MDTLELVKKRMEKLNPLHKRMDEDAKKAYMDKFVLKSAFGRDIPGSISVTLNKPAVYLNSVVSWILNAVWQTFVEGGISEKTKTYVERFSNDTFAEANERRANRGEKTPMEFFANHICLRGWIGRRLVWQTDGKDVYLDDLPIDMRYAAYETDKSGYIWVAPTYWRSAAELQKKYPNAGIPDSEQLLEVTDFWDDSINEVYVDDKLVLKEDNKIGYPPFVIASSPAGFMLLDKENIKHRGESIFFLDRDLFESWNQLVSIDQTLALMAVDPTYQMELDNLNDKVDSPTVSGGSVIKTKRGSPLKLVEQQDIKMANRLASEVIEGAIKQGALSEVDIATPPQVTSALWITNQSELRNKLLVPLLKTIEAFSGQSTRMSIDQYIKGKFDSYVGVQGRASKYKASELGDLNDYTVSYRLMTRSRKQEMANIVLMGAAKGSLPRKTIVEDIYMSSEPEKILAQLDDEEAGELNPVIKSIRLTCSLIDMADLMHGEEAEQKYYEAERMAEYCYQLIQNESALQQQNLVEQDKAHKNKQETMNKMMGISAMGNESITGV